MIFLKITYAVLLITAAALFLMGPMATVSLIEDWRFVIFEQANYLNGPEVRK